MDQLVQLITSSVETFKAEYQKRGYNGPSLEDTSPHTADAIPPSIELKHASQVIEGACAQLCAIVNPPQHTICNHLEIACFRVVVEAKVADHLKDSPDGLSVADLSLKTGIEAGKLGRIMRLLATKHFNDLFSSVQDGVFTNNRLSATLVSDSSMHALMGHFTDEAARAGLLLSKTLTDPEWSPSYAHNKTCFNRLTGYDGPLWTYLNDVDAAMGERLSTGMIGLSKGIGAGALLTTYPWNDLPEDASFCDVGGGVGFISMQVAGAFPNVRIVLHDLPPTVKQAESVWAEHCPEVVAQKRIEFAPIDFFVNPVQKGCNVYYLKNILHDWPDDKSKAIIENIKNGMQPSSRLLIQEYIIQHLQQPSGNVKMSVAPSPLLPNFGEGKIRQHYLDLEMLIMHNSQERTLEEYVRLCAACGLDFVKAYDCGETGVLEFKLASN
ncbi:S-adenosyl-L-methionine-dependent methyltransferase [Punctularia strigosozonata HHB-11173 SS5]|uniref:S-adenosyl-L-methionine-dependent methyltransferase n=1 Tax=Punctularia strigosozonata (strain HHB-11173) TaxID=741275 RepID=UPI000441635C|nr:S-adenosyl-L-methionine-dependent methyltransferase [Punctularia strigosozonata HHB-11173 SS5]EIN06887.1 S-adenosyl-L-methionine-dependent methyltransferase [Punctularia strigosozonata HHB-11173 SS5]